MSFTRAGTSVRWLFALTADASVDLWMRLIPEPNSVMRARTNKLSAAPENKLQYSLSAEQHATFC